MKSRSTYLMLGILALAVGGVLWQRVGNQRQQQAAVQRQELIALAAADPVDRITIKRKDFRVTLAKAGQTWVVSSADNAKAETSAIEELLGNLRDLKVLSAAGTGDAELAAFGLSEDRRTELTLEVGGTAVRSLWFGREENFSGTAYAKRPNEATTYLVRYLPVDLFNREDWRDKAILRFGPTDIKEIVYTKGKRAFTLTNDGGTWQLDGKPAKQEAARTFAENLGLLNAVDFPPVDDEFKPSGVSIAITLQDRQIELALGQTNADDNTYLKTSEGKLYLIANTNRTRLTKERKEFVP